jgi:acetyl esterase/lipase
VCVSANYRLQPHTRRDALIDVKRAIAWIRAHAHDYGADPASVFLAGGSAGGYLSAMAAVTQNDPSLQPGFEQADTSVTAVIALYGYFGDRGDDAPGTAPLTTDATGAPPVFVVHGDHDTLALVAGARLFAAQLRAESAEPVVYAELPGAQHVWDLAHSIRSDTVVNAVEAFTAWVRSRG